MNPFYKYTSNGSKEVGLYRFPHLSRMLLLPSLRLLQHCRRNPKPLRKKGVTIKEPLPPTKPKVAEVEGKGKGKQVEPPAKRQKMTMISDPR